jgi:hypothetical protein
MKDDKMAVALERAAKTFVDCICAFLILTAWYVQSIHIQMG